MISRIPGSMAIIFSLLFSAGCSSTPSKQLTHSVEAYNGTLVIPEASEVSVVYFGLDSAQLNDENQIKLNDMLGLVNDDHRLEVVGHACELGSAAHNQRLSEHRARTVKNYLESRGIPSDKIIYRGEGERYPVRGNATEIMREENRRVEIQLIR